MLDDHKENAEREVINIELNDDGSEYTGSTLIFEAMKSLVHVIESHMSDLLYNAHNAILQTIKDSLIVQIEKLLKSFEDFDFSKYSDKLNHEIFVEFFDAKWVIPFSLLDKESGLFLDFCDVIDSTRKSKNRIKKIDRLLFDYFSKDRINSFKKEWRSLGIPEHKMRMMHQSIQAYHRKEYALTVVMLSTLWEGIIYEKANDSRRKKTDRTKSNFKKLIDNSDYEEIYCKFFEEYIMYDCNSETDVKDDVPGRHSSAHSWYNKYPSRKAALNAILFTDFLLNMTPLED